MKLYLKGKKVLVIASPSGIGKEIATSLAKEGATVLVNGRYKEKVDVTIKKFRQKSPNLSFFQ